MLDINDEQGNFGCAAIVLAAGLSLAAICGVYSWERLEEAKIELEMEKVKHVDK